MIGVILLIISFLLVIGLLIWSISYTRKHIDEKPAIKYRASACLFSVGLILSLGYIFTAKRFSDYLDLIMNWMILSSGLLFASTVSFIIGYLHNKMN